MPLSISKPTNKDKVDFPFVKERASALGDQRLNLVKLQHEYTLTSEYGLLSIGTGTDVAILPYASPGSAFSVTSDENDDFRTVDIIGNPLFYESVSLLGSGLVLTSEKFTNFVVAASEPHGTATITIGNEAGDESYYTIGPNETKAWSGMLSSEMIPFCSDFWQTEVASGASPLTYYFSAQPSGYDVVPRITNQFAPSLDCVNAVPGKTLEFKAKASTTSKTAALKLGAIFIDND